MLLRDVLKRDCIYEFFAKEIAYGRPDHHHSDTYGRSRDRTNYSHDYFIDVNGNEENNPAWSAELRYLFLPWLDVYTYPVTGAAIDLNFEVIPGLESMVFPDGPSGRAVDPRKILLGLLGFTFEGIVDKPDFGLFAWFFKSTGSYYPNIVAIRGTEFNTADLQASEATAKDAFNDLTKSIGQYQYFSGRSEIEEKMQQIKADNGKDFVITGHSLGGALAQQVVAGASPSISSMIEELVTYMSPGIGKETVSRFETKIANGTHVMPEIRHHVNFGDFVDLAGGDKILHHGGNCVYHHICNEYYATKRWWKPDWARRAEVLIGAGMGPHSLTCCSTHPNLKKTSSGYTDPLVIGGFDWSRILNQRHMAQVFKPIIEDRFNVSSPPNPFDHMAEFLKGAQWNAKFHRWTEPTEPGVSATVRYNTPYGYEKKSVFDFVEKQRLKLLEDFR
jgi:hypothetical protein